MNIKNILRFVLVSLAIGWIFDQLFWKHTPGISILIFLVIYLAGLTYLTWAEGLRPPRTSYLLLFPVLFFAAFTSIRLEPFTVFVCILLMTVCLLILSMTWMGGGWMKYSLSDYFVRFFLLIGGVFTLGIERLSPKKKNESDPEKTGKNIQAREISRKVLLPVGCGLMLAIPILLILGGLLSNADPIFGSQLEVFWNAIFDTNIWELLLRAFYILLVAYLLFGGFLFSLVKSRDEKLLGLEKPVIPQSFNWISSATVVACVDLLFAFFVYVQFRYFFGGQANIAADGYTYAEYARQGFNELVIVAFLSLLLFLGLSTITRRAEGKGRLFYSGLGVVLVLLIGVILVSSFQRLGLYEAAYGFSRIRTYSHIFMIWLGVLLAATVFLEISNRLRSFAFVTLMVALGFGVTLTLLNVDSFIARQNLARSARGEELDIPYLVSLSDDVMPDLYDVYTQNNSGSPLHHDIKSILSCRYRESLRSPAPSDWQSFHWSHYSTSIIYSQIFGELHLSNSTTWGSAPVVVDGQEVTCFNPDDSYSSPEID
ncbi:MAG: DUF4153 domain-containing protein [Anaerolineaceae bacterium]